MLFKRNRDLLLLVESRGDNWGAASCSSRDMTGMMVLGLGLDNIGM